MLRWFSSSSTSRKCFHRACETIAGPDEHDVEAAVTSILHEFIEAWAAGAGAADTVIDILLDDLQVALRGQGTQVMDLRLRILPEFHS